MVQKRISKKELLCIENHLAYCVKAILRDNKATDLSCVYNYSPKDLELVKMLVTSFMLVDELYEE